MHLNSYHIAKVCYWLQLHRLAYFLNRKRKRIITFHNVLSDDVYASNVANGVSNSLSSFQRIIDEVATRFQFSLDLDDPSTVTITFDDGYCNQATVAGRYLQNRNIPAYLFVSGQLIKRSAHTALRSLTIDKLLHWVSYVPEGEYDILIFGEIIKFSIYDDTRAQIWSTIIWPLFIRDAGSKGDALFSAVDNAYSYSSILEKLPDKYKQERLDGITPTQLESLKQSGWQIGWHTESHYPVAKLLLSDRDSELTPDPVCNSSVFSFPYGGINDTNYEVLEILPNKGITTAVSNINYGNDKYGKWYRSRMLLTDNKYILNFELSGLKYLIKYKRLLPII